MYRDLKKILISKEEIDKRIKELAAELDRDYQGKRPLMVAILKGSIMFYADLLRAMTIPLELDFMAISSYGNKTKSSGEVRMIKDLDRSIEGRHIIIVEDIVDSGYTLSYLKRMLYSRHPESVKICTLLDKFECREVPLEPDYKGFDIGNEFVVGYGLDYAEKYRNLPEIGILKEEVYENK
ncbi:MAG: hypoxanthine phosphoribosyltransferase [Clostridia bacterium]|nr:hypoxanthine phosphoribosyltransferase [Clostridia bacterium]